MKSVILSLASIAFGASGVVWAETNFETTQPQRANVCDAPQMMDVLLSGQNEETVIRTSTDLPAITAYVCANANNNQTVGGKGIVYLRFSASAPPPQGSPRIGSLDANTCMLVRTNDRVYASISTDFGGGVCVRYLED